MSNETKHPTVKILLTPADLEYKGTDSFDRLCWRHKMTRRIYCTVDLRSNLDDVLAGKASLYVKESSGDGVDDIDGEPSYAVRLAPAPAVSLHAALLAAGLECNNQMGNSDLFVEDTDAARAIIAQYPHHERNIRMFTDNVSKKPSIEIPFAFERDRPKVEVDPDSLAGLRAKWEKGFDTYVALQSNESVYVVCSGGNRTLYTCLHYFPVCGQWQVSADLQGANLPAVWAWLTRINPPVTK